MDNVFTDERAVNRLKHKAKDDSLTDDEYKELLLEALDTISDYINNPFPPLCIRSAVQKIAFLNYLQANANKKTDWSDIKSYSYSEGDVSESVTYSTPEEFSEKISSLISEQLNSLNHLRVVRYELQNENS